MPKYYVWTVKLKLLKQSNLCSQKTTYLLHPGSPEKLHPDSPEKLHPDSPEKLHPVIEIEYSPIYDFQ